MHLDAFDFFRWVVSIIATIYATLVTLQSLWGWYVFLSGSDKYITIVRRYLVLHSLPFSEQRADFYHWHVEILPKLTRTAGFESGTGFYINPTSPEEAAQVLRAAKIG